jgi:hypothetical protein
LIYQIVWWLLEIVLKGLIHDVFGDGENFEIQILTFKNDDAQVINSKDLNLISGDSNYPFSADFVNEEETGSFQLNS